MPPIKGPGRPIDWNAQLTEQFHRIVTDFSYFCEHLNITGYDYTKPPTESTIINAPLILKPVQKSFINYLNQPATEKVILKTRQRGYSTILVARCLWRLLYSKNETILYTIDKEDKANNFRLMMANLYNSIPAHYRPSDLKIQASNDIFNKKRNNRMFLRTASEDTGRSGTFSMAILDEFAYYEPRIQSSIMASIVPACPNNRIILSTPKKELDLYHQKVLKAGDMLWKENFWDYAEDWYGSLENAKLWRHQAELELTKPQIIRELDCEFKGAIESPIWTIEPSIFKPFTNQPKSVIISMDLGYSDDTAVLFANISSDRRLHIFGELITNHTILSRIIKSIKDLKYPILYGIMDSAGKKVDQTSGISSYNEARKLLGCAFYTRKTDKIEMLRITNSALLKGLISIDNIRCPKLTEMLYNYEWGANDNIPHNHYSHIHDAFVYLGYNYLKNINMGRNALNIINKSSIMTVI